MPAAAPADYPFTVFRPQQSAGAPAVAADRSVYMAAAGAAPTVTLSRRGLAEQLVLMTDGIGPEMGDKIPKEQEGRKY